MSHSSITSSAQSSISMWPPADYPNGQTLIVAVCLYRNSTQSESQILQHATFQHLDEAKAFAETMAQMVTQSPASATEAACFRCAVLQLTITDSGMDVRFLHECPIAVGGIQS